jgi:hypothetical protein
MGYSGTLVFLDVAWLTVLYGQKVGNPLENRPFSVADLEFEPSGVTAGLQRHSFRIWQGGAGFPDPISHHSTSAGSVGLPRGFRCGIRFT